MTRDKSLAWMYGHTCAYTLCGAYHIDNLDNGYFLLCCRASGLRKLCASMKDAMLRAERSHRGIPHQF